MMRKFFCFFFIITLLGEVAFVDAQQSTKLARIGYLSGGTEPARRQYMEAFRQGMQKLGYVEGQNFLLDSRFAEGKFERLPSLVQELVSLNPHVLLVSTTPANLAAKATVTTIPIVMVAVADPVGVGLVVSLVRPGGNITGITNIVADLAGKRLEILKEIVPNASRVAVLVNRAIATAPLQIRNADAAARALGIQPQPALEVRDAKDIAGAFEAAVRARARAAIRMVHPLISSLRTQTADLASKHKLPVI